MTKRDLIRGNSTTNTSASSDVSDKDLTSKASKQCSNQSKENEGKMLQSIPDSALFPTCVLGIYTCYFAYGYLQEEIIAVSQISAGVPLFMQYLTALLISLGVKIFLSSSNDTKFKLVRYKELRIGFINNCSMFGSNYALKYVDYPTQALFKSSKILPVMGLGLIRRTYSYPLYKYI